jgi:Dolichyl-phosphate-mannose-protein mannosyltransferase
MSEPIERRLSAAIVIAATAVFALLLLVLPSYFPTFDEAKYLGIGVDIWAGRGITTVFGVLFMSHAPAWPAIIALPHAMFGVDALAVGRFLDAICGIAIIALTGALGWRIRPIVGAIAAAGLLALVYLHDLTRTARLDVPAAALLLLYLFIAFSAFRRGSVRLGIAAGVVFAAGFLVKEVDLPFAPAPLFAAILWGVPWRSLGRTGAAILAVGSVGVAPWFIYYAATLHLVYRLDAPAWVLAPIGIAIATMVVVGLSAERIGQGAPGARIAALAGRLGSERRLRTIVAWGLTLVWAAAMTYAFAKTARLTGTTFLGIDQLRLYAQTWFSALRAVAVFGITGVVFAIVSLVVEPDVARARGIRDLVIATICGIPLVLLVIAVGEPPRNYLANLAIITILAAAGWVWAVELLLRTRRTLLLVGATAVVGAAGGFVVAGLVSTHPVRLGVAGAIVGAGAAALVVGLDRRGRLVRPLVVPAVALAVLISGTTVLVAHGRNTLAPAGGQARSQAVETATAWIRNNIPAGTTIAYGSFLAYETAYPLADQYRAVAIPARLSVSSATAPDGLQWDAETPGDDWVALDIAPRNVDQFEGFRASWITTSFARTGATYWVYTTGIDTSSPTIEAALTTATGFQKVIEWSFPVPGAPPFQTTIYRVDPGRIAFDTKRLAVAPEALDRLVGLLRARGPTGRSAAARLLGVVAVEPPGPAADAALAALRALSGP